MIWFCEQDMTERQVATGYPNLADALDAAGIRAVRLRLDDVTPAAAASYGLDLVGAWGPLGFLRRVREVFSDRCDGVYDQAEAREYRHYATHLGHLMLNGSYQVVPFAVAACHPLINGSNGIFVKPAIDAKKFTGIVLTKASLAEKLGKLAHVPGEMSCIVAPARGDINSEYRFVISDGKVITGSQYQRDGKLDVRRDVMPAAENLARIVATMEWQAAPVYVCDVAVTDSGAAFVVELNPFSSCGLYACDTVAIAQALREHHVAPAALESPPAGVGR